MKRMSFPFFVVWSLAHERNEKAKAKKLQPDEYTGATFSISNLGMMGIKELSVSSGSACTSASLEPSYVLHALGVEDEMAHTSIRLGIGRFTTEEEVDLAAESLVKAVTKLREMSPLWEMAQEGIDIKSIQWAAH